MDSAADDKKKKEEEQEEEPEIIDVDMSDDDSDWLHSMRKEKKEQPEKEE